MGLNFPSPLGVAAGVDKDATWYDSLGALGFGFVEVGTVTARSQPGNRRPRVFRLPRDRAILNRMGFPNPGSEAVADRLYRRTGQTIIGVNVGKSKVVPIEDAAKDYRESVRRLAELSDYLVINVSSPNTPGLVEMQDVDRLRALIMETRAELRDSRVPVLVKIAPDLADTAIDAIAGLAVDMALDGIIAVNTTVDCGGLTTSADAVSDLGYGGISGAPLKTSALRVLRRLYEQVGDRLVLISVGGIETPEDAWERILAGATLVQAHTGFVYEGPLWPRRMNRELARLAREAGVSSIQEAVGRGATKSSRDVASPESFASQLDAALTNGRNAPAHARLLHRP